MIVEWPAEHQIPIAVEHPAVRPRGGLGACRETAADGKGGPRVGDIDAGNRSAGVMREPPVRTGRCTGVLQHAGSAAKSKRNGAVACGVPKSAWHPTIGDCRPLEPSAGNANAAEIIGGIGQHHRGPAVDAHPTGEADQPTDSNRAPDIQTARSDEVRSPVDVHRRAAHLHGGTRRQIDRAVVHVILDVVLRRGRVGDRQGATPEVESAGDVKRPGAATAGPRLAGAEHDGSVDRQGIGGSVHCNTTGAQDQRAAATGADRKGKVRIRDINASDTHWGADGCGATGGQRQSHHHRVTHPWNHASHPASAKIERRGAVRLGNASRMKRRLRQQANPAEDDSHWQSGTEQAERREDRSGKGTHRG